MKTALTALTFLALNLLFPVLAYATEPLRQPLSYSLREYGFILGVALLGGLANYIRRVQKGEMQMLTAAALIGTLVISAFAGLLTFWGCEALELNPLWTAALTGIAGHAGGSGIEWFETLTKRYVVKRLGLSDTTMPGDLGDK